MLLIGLLLLALAGIVVGVVSASGPWFVGSLIASGLAAVMLFRQRAELSGGSKKADEDGAPAKPRGQTSLVTGTAFAGTPAGESDGSGEAAVAGATSVWVLDGQPEYHLESCSLLDKESAEAIPLDQAREDGFRPCEICKPDEAMESATAETQADSAPSDSESADEPATGPATGPASAPASSETGSDGSPEAESDASDEVWVVDGRPRFHRKDCELIAKQDAEAVPRAQAIEDGFLPCTACTP